MDGEFRPEHNESAYLPIAAIERSAALPARQEEESRTDYRGRDRTGGRRPHVVPIERPARHPQHPQKKGGYY